MKVQTLLVLVWGSILSAQQLALSIPPPGQIRPGATISIPATLTGGANIVAFQVTLRSTIGGVDAGAWKASVGPASTAAAKQIQCATVTGEFRCIVYGLNANVIADGIVATFDLAIPANASNGRVMVTSSALGASPTGNGVALTTAAK